VMGRFSTLLSFFRAACSAASIRRVSCRRVIWER
jgi:hypothetical protein